MDELDDNIAESQDRMIGLLPFICQIMIKKDLQNSGMSERGEMLFIRETRA